MLRTLTGFGIAMALASAAQAQQVAVSLHGKSSAAIRAELHRAAEQVCADEPSALDPIDDTCVAATYEDALRQARASLRARPTAFVQATPAGLR